MGAFGDRLQREREMRGITLDEIAEATKIGTRSLRALEAEDFDKLPGGIFNKGFVRAYARYLGIDEEQAVADYMVAVKEADEPASEPEPVQAIAAAKLNKEKESSEAEPAGAPWRAFLVILLIAALAAGGWYFYNRRKAQQEAAITVPEPAPAPVVPVTASPQPDTTAATSTTSAPKTTDASATNAVSKPAPAASPASSQDSNSQPAAGTTVGFVVRIRAVKDSWIEIAADGKVVVSRMLNASQETEAHAQKLMVLKTGNAGGVEVSHNGKAIASLGPENKTRTVTFTPAGMQ